MLSVDYVLSGYGTPVKPVVWLAVRDRDYLTQSVNLSRAITEYTGKVYPAQDYVCNLFVRRSDRCGVGGSYL